MLKRLFYIVLCITLVFSLSGCGYEYQNPEVEQKYTKELAGTQLNVYNWGEYISDGSDGCMNVNLEFERLTGIKVNYTTFESNETMYSQLINGGVTYDVIIPSDYMIDRLRRENLLQKIDFDKIPNYKYIKDDYKGLFFDEKQEYSVPYNVGMVGIIYNSSIIQNPKKSWTALWDEKYRNMSLNFSNPRDAFMTAQMILGQDLNSENKQDWNEAAELLKQGKDVLQSYVMDEIYGKMETGEAAIGTYYAGDYLTMVETNPDLKFFYPKEGTNIFVDSACIPKTAQNYEAALMYINFLLEPEIALANAEYIGYASPNAAVIENPDYYYYKNEILYPAKEDMPPVQYYHDISEEIRMHYENLWLDVKLY